MGGRWDVEGREGFVFAGGHDTTTGGKNGREGCWGWRGCCIRRVVYNIESSCERDISFVAEFVGFLRDRVASDALDGERGAARDDIGWFFAKNHEDIRDTVDRATARVAAGLALRVTKTSVRAG